MLTRKTRGGLRAINTHGDSGEYHLQVKSGTCDQRRRTSHPMGGCDVDAASPGSWHRGESPYAPPPAEAPGGIQVPGQAPARSRSHLQVLGRFRIGSGYVTGRRSTGSGRWLAGSRRAGGQGAVERQLERGSTQSPAARRRILLLALPRTRLRSGLSKTRLAL